MNTKLILFVIDRKWSNSLCMVLAKARSQSYIVYILFFVGLSACEIFPTLSSLDRWKYSVWTPLILSWILCWWARPTSSLETVSPPSRLLSRGREMQTNCRLSFSDLMILSATLKQREQNSKGFYLRCRIAIFFKFNNSWCFFVVEMEDNFSENNNCQPK